MAFLLGVLLIVAVLALGFLGFYAFGVSLQLARVEAQAKLHQEQESQTVTQYQALAAKYNEDTKRLKEYCTNLKAENGRVAKWKNMSDAEVKCAEMIRNAKATAENAKTEAASLVCTAQERSAALLAEAEQNAASQLAIATESTSKTVAEAKTKAKTLTEESQGILDSITSQVAQILEAANKKAEDIAGSAYEALKNAALYDRTVKAMKNAINGYGSQYLIPQQSLLDDLADTFSHKEAGRELKRAREVTKTMLRNRTAGSCGYAEAQRRDTAVNFVVDAFNGKVDSILSRVKHDNVGTLGQQIRDAYALVNCNGKAFRDARITEAYLDARLDELKWAAIVQQYVIEEREEQRKIREQAREDARAQKEHEKALREADKEEEAFQRALEQTREQFERASGEQRAMYEQRLREVEEKLREAHERRERAKSMAEKTKMGYVYIISNIGSFGEDVFKIGLTRRYDPQERVRELGDSSVPFEFDVHAMILSEDAPALEHQLHKHFLLNQVNKVNHRREFFRASLTQIREEIERLGITTGVHWTMMADARQYRETLAIDKAIKENPADREAWISRQLKLEEMAEDLLEPAGVSDEDE